MYFCFLSAKIEQGCAKSWRTLGKVFKKIVANAIFSVSALQQLHLSHLQLL